MAFFPRQKYRIRYPEVWRGIGPMHYATVWGTTIYDLYKRIDGAWVVRKDARIIGRYWKPYEGKMAIREDIWVLYRGCSTGYEFRSFVENSFGIPDEPMYRSHYEYETAASTEEKISVSLDLLPSRLEGLMNADRKLPRISFNPPLKKNKKTSERSCKLKTRPYNTPVDQSDPDNGTLTKFEIRELQIEELTNNTNDSSESISVLNLSPSTLKERYMSKSETPKKASKEGAKDSSKNVNKVNPNGATPEEVQAVVDGTLKLRAKKGTADDDNMTSTTADGRLKGRPLGVTTGLTIYLACAYFLQQNQKAAKKDKLTDPQLADKLKEEFPGRETSWFSSTPGWRRSFNDGKFSKGTKPKIVSTPFDEKGDVTETKRGRGGSTDGETPKTKAGIKTVEDDGKAEAPAPKKKVKKGEAVPV